MKDVEYILNTNIICILIIRVSTNNPIYGNGYFAYELNLLYERSF